METSVPASLPSAAVRQSNFEQGVAYSLHLWPALALAVENGWGGPDSSDKRDWFAGAVVDLFPEFSDAPQPSALVNNNKKTVKPSSTSSLLSSAEGPDLEEVETVLLQVMMDEFEVNVDDDSGNEVADNIIRVRKQCEIGNFEEVEKLKERFMNRKGTKTDVLFKRIEDADQDTDWESDATGDDDDDDDDVKMEAAAPQLVKAPKEKAQPQVDEDGFTLVAKR